MQTNLTEKFKKIKLLGLDVDGIMTDGSLYLGAEGEVFKPFHAHDGLGIRLALEMGLKIVVISGRESAAMASRAKELGIQDTFLGIRDKLAVMRDLWSKYGVTPQKTAFLGDDLNDLSVLREVGLACTVPQGVPEVKKVCHFVTQKKGGKGAVRELIELILQSRGRWPY